MGHCSKCGKETQVRRLNNGVCAICSKRTAKTIVGAPPTGLLTAGALEQLPLERQEIGPTDSLSMIGE